MTHPFVIAVPAKGRLQENAEAFFARAPSPKIPSAKMVGNMMDMKK